MTLFRGSADYWDKRYAKGGTSGPGSRGTLAEYKAEYLNNLFDRFSVSDVVEFGCGDGYQLSLLKVGSYLGVDVSPRAVTMCRERYRHDSTKQFVELPDWEVNLTCDVALSLDVIYHLVEDHVYHAHMEALFAASGSYVVVYSSDRDVQDDVQEPHVRHRSFSAWVATHALEWRLLERKENPYPLEGDLRAGTFAHFAVFAHADVLANKAAQEPAEQPMAVLERERGDLSGP